MSPGLYITIFVRALILFNHRNIEILRQSGLKFQLVFEESVNVLTGMSKADNYFDNWI